MCGRFAPAPWGGEQAVVEWAEFCFGPVPTGGVARQSASCVDPVRWRRKCSTGWSDTCDVAARRRRHGALTAPRCRTRCSLSTCSAFFPCSQAAYTSSASRPGRSRSCVWCATEEDEVVGTCLPGPFAVAQPQYTRLPFAANPLFPFAAPAGIDGGPLFFWTSTRRTLPCSPSH